MTGNEWEKSYMTSTKEEAIGQKMYLQVRLFSKMKLFVFMYIVSREWENFETFTRRRDGRGKAFSFDDNNSRFLLVWYVLR